MVSKTPPIKAKKKVDSKKNSDAVLFVAQEINFARVLAGNDEKKRAKMLKSLKKWFSVRFDKGTVFKQDDFMRIWKGLFYSMWMSDKPLIQEALSESIAAILDIFPTNKVKYSMMFFYCGLRTLATEWYGLDQHRIDKFMMFLRRFLRAALRCLERDSWSLKSCQMFVKQLSKEDAILSVTPPTYARNALGMQMHLVDCYLEEIAKVSKGVISGDSLAELIRPMARYMALGSEPRLCAWIKKNIFIQIIKQSPMGIEYNEKKKAWEKMGCPEGGPDALEVEPASDSEGEQSDSDTEDLALSALDPRAGRVDVVLPTMDVPCQQLVEMMTPLAIDQKSTGSNRHRVRACLQHFKDLGEGRYPLTTQGLTPVLDSDLKTPNKTKAAKKLLDFEKKLVAESDELALRGLSRKKRKRVLAKIRSGGDDAGDSQRRDAIESPVKKAKVDKPKAKKTSKTTAEEKKHTIKTDAKKSKKKHIEKIDKKEKFDPSVKLERSLASAIIKAGKEIKEKTTKQEKGKKLEKPTKAKKAEKLSTIKKSLSKKVETKKALSQKLKKFSKDTILRGKAVDKKTVSFAPKKVTIALKNNTVQAPLDYVKSVKESPKIPFDSSKRPVKTNLKPNCTPSPINPFYKKKLKLNF